MATQSDGLEHDSRVRFEARPGIDPVRQLCPPSVVVYITTLRVEVTPAIMQVAAAGQVMAERNTAPTGSADSCQVWPLSPETSTTAGAATDDPAAPWPDA
jgi:hypothetical protein